mgnify:FL=1
MCGGTLGAISGNGLTRTATFTPTAGLASGSASITVASGTYTDAAGNSGGAGTTPSISIDTLAPTLAIASNVAALKSGETATITFTFSEDPGVSFVSGDVITSNGTIGAIIGTGLTRTATFTPTAGLASGSASITVANGTYADAAGNSGGAGTTPSITIDTLAPTLAITSSASALRVGQTATITFTFSEDPGNTFTWDGNTGDVVISGGTLGAISGSGLTRTATFTPTAGLASGSASITVASGTYTDAAGNSGGAGTTPSITIDNLAPTLAITSNLSALKAGQTATITFAFSEDPGASFTASDVLTSNGTIGAVSGSGLTRTATFTPTAGLASGSASITVASGTYTDAAGNAGGAGTTPSITLDTLAPTLTITSNLAAIKSGDTATITFTFSEDPGTSFVTGDVVTANGLMLPTLSGSGLTRTGSFRPTTGIASGNISISVASGAYTDAAGNAGGAGTIPSTPIDTLSPTLTITSNVAALKAGETATITFTFSEDPGASFIASDVVTVRGTIGAISGSGLTRTATFTPTVNQASSNASLSVAIGTYTDGAGNANTQSSTRSISLDTLVPTATLTTGSFTNAGSATVQSSEVGTAYLVDSTLSVTDLSSITGATTNRWNSVAIATANSNSSLALTGLIDGSYRLYTVDAAGNLSAASSNLVTIATPIPTVTGLTLTSATGIQNNTLNAGDVLSATVTFSEAVTVSGSPQLALHIGSDTVQASYASGSGTTTLTYTYTILANQTDANGISIDADPLSLNSGTILSTATSAPATLTRASVADNGSFLVDTTAPSATATTATLLATDSTSVQSSEVGTAYLVNGTVTVTNLAAITTAADAQWNSVTIATANSPTSLSLAGLDQGTYKLYTVDAAGNLSAASTSGVTVTPAVIDLPSVQSLAASKLIAPVNVGGNWYYFWDLSGNGSADSGDYWTDHNILDAIFNQSITGTTGVGDTTDTQRYATIGGVRLALPTLTNLIAIHDNQIAIHPSSGLPTGWLDAFWSATSVGPDEHNHYFLGAGSPYPGLDVPGDNVFLVALQVL